MTQQGFEDYLIALYGSKTGTVRSYITAIHIIDELFANNDIFALGGESILNINETALLMRITDFICVQQTLFIKEQDSFFDKVKNSQISYPKGRFCSAAIKKLLDYSYSLTERKADEILINSTKASTVSKELTIFFDLDKEGNDVVVESRARVGQAYFRKMVLANYDNKCCVTGLNVPATLRASHIVRWADDKSNRMNPENGLCLSATYDEAFDKHLISFDENYKMIVGKEIKDYYTNEVTREYFEKFEGKEILLPRIYLPSKKLLEKHRNLMII